MSLDLNLCDKACLGCVKNYKSKHKLQTGEPFKISCAGIPNDYVQLGLGLGIEDTHLAKVVMDPVTWAVETLDWHCLDPDGEIWKRKNPQEYYDWKEANPDKDILGYSRYHRPYQAEMLRCSSKRKVFRIGRQCLVGKSKVLLANGLTKQIKDICINDTVVSVVNNKIIPSKVTDHWEAGKKTVYKIKTKFGHSITCTDNHRFLIANKEIDRYHGFTINDIPHEWLSIKSGLKQGSKIAVPLKIPHPELFEDNITLASFLGYFIADGSCSKKQSAKFTNTNMDYLLEFEQLSKSLGTNVKWYAKGNGYDLIITNGRNTKNPVRELLTEFNLTNITGPDKKIPNCIFNASRQTTQAFIKAFWAADGYISTFKRTNRTSYRTEIGTLQENLELVEQVQEILWRFGVHGYIKKEGNAYRYVISNKISINNFLNEIGLIPGKEKACQKALNNLSNINDCFSNVSNELLWDYVSSIEEIGVEDTWDIEVAGPSNFIANNIVTHNSGKTECLVISMLYNMFVKPDVPEDVGFTIIVITPYQAQIDLIFGRMIELIRSSPITNNSLRRNVKAPIYTLELHNNSAVKGFTAGTKSGGNAEAVRGQHGNMLVFDEADYLSRGDMDAAMSIITNYPTATLWMSSTPSGKRDRFYETCRSKRYKEFFFPSSCNPLWSNLLEEDFREGLTEIGYKHEVLAEFAEQEEGVFQNVYVQNAKADYKYGKHSFLNTWTYTMGVDWNDTKNGTTINVLGYDPNRGKFIIVDRDVVSRDGWTQLAACHRIAELNRAWQPIAIYLDSGYGGTQWEVIRKFGWDSLSDPTKGPTHPDSRLQRIVHQYDFGSKIETRDLFTKQPLKKPAKPFLVESTVRRFETGDIEFSKYDEALEKQLLGYVIDRFTPTGTPVYEADESAGDHALDALMLSIVAFVMEVTPFGKPKFDSSISFTGNFGERTDAVIHQGDTVLKRDNKEAGKIKREHSRPTADRTAVVEQRSLFSSRDLPANHVQQEPSVGIWRHDGFMKNDAPPPRVRTLSEAGDIARKRVGLKSRHGGRPRRKNI